MPVLAVFCVCVILIILPLSLKLMISEFCVARLYYPFTKMDIFLTDVVNAKSNNIELNQRIIKLSTDNAQYIEDHYENIRLRRMLDFDLQLPFRLVPAEVIGIKPGLMSKSIIINTRGNRGIINNMPVVTADGIVGKTIEIIGNTAVVQLLVDYNCKVSAVDQNTRSMGIIRWQGGKFLEMGDVPIESQVAVGDTIVSSGLGGIFPSGLMVGTVIYSQNRGATLFKDVKVRPAVNFGSLEEVFVVIYNE